MAKRKHSRLRARTSRKFTDSRRVCFESLEDRLVLTWNAVPPVAIPVPKAFTAIKLNTSSSATGNASIASSEVDYYSFTAGLSGQYIISATTPNSNLDPVLGVFSATGTRLDFINDISSNNTDSRLALNLVSGTHYFVGISNNLGSPQGSYSWAINGPGTSFVDDLQENVTGALVNGNTVNSTNNNTVTFGFVGGQPQIITDEAYNLGVLSTQKTLPNLAMLDGSDWYKFTITSAGTASESVSIAFQQSQGDLELELWSLAGSAISPSKPIKPIATSTGIGNSESISLFGLPAGTYYAHVYGYQGTINPNYSLTVTLPVIPTWQKVATTNATKGPTDIQHMQLLSDGSIMVQSGNGQIGSTAWFRYTPNTAGNYASGTWSTLTADPFARVDFSTLMLQNGDVLVFGGDDSDPTDPMATEIFDPTANAGAGSWTATQDFPEASLAADPSEVLPNGTVLAGSALDNSTFVFDPTANAGAGAWSTSGLTEAVFPAAGNQPILSTNPNPPPANITIGLSGGSTWVSLGNGNILAYDSVDSDFGDAILAEEYNPSTGIWTDASKLDANKPAGLLTSFNQLDFMGPGFLLPNGQAFFFGANGNTAYFNPAANSGAGAWIAGPAEPERLINTVTTSMVSTGGPGVVLPNGDILITLSPEGTVNDTFDAMFNLTGEAYNFPSPTFLYEFNPVTKIYTDVTPSGVPIVNSDKFSMIDLPSGQVLLGSEGGQLQVYNPTISTIQNSLRPVIQSVVPNGSNSFTLSGLQLSGMSEGSASGDISMNASNFPLVRLTNAATGLQYYARTSNWSSSGVQTGATAEMTDFTLPSGMPAGTYNLVVVANGIASNPMVFNQALAVAVVVEAVSHTVSTPTITSAAKVNTAVTPASSTHVTTVSAPVVTAATTTTLVHATSSPISLSTSSLNAKLIDSLMPEWDAV